MNKHYVYVIFRPNGTPCYVGKGKNRRWRYHFWKSHNPYLRNIIEKSGGDLPVVITRENLSEIEANNTEKMLIAAIGRIPAGPLVNMTDGGEGVCGLVFSEEAKQKIRDTHKGRKFTEEHKEKIRIALLTSPAHHKLGDAGRGRKKT